MAFSTILAGKVYERHQNLHRLNYRLPDSCIKRRVLELQIMHTVSKERVEDFWMSEFLGSPHVILMSFAFAVLPLASDKTKRGRRCCLDRGSQKTRRACQQCN